MDSSAMDSSTDELTVKYQWTIANRLSTTCPAASRFYFFKSAQLSENSSQMIAAMEEKRPHHASANLEKKLIDEPKLLKKDVKRTFLYCNHCGSLWSPGNHKVRVRAPPSVNNHLKKLLKIEAEQPWRLNNRQKKKLKKFKESTSKIVYICNICKKSTTFPGAKKHHRNDNVPFSASVPKIISKKGDLNAGLFIKTSNHDKILEPQDKKETLNQPVLERQKSQTSELTDLKIKNKATSVNKLSVKDNAVKSLNKKKKKGLLMQILNQEQESKKKKNNLSSFLVSL